MQFYYQHALTDNWAKPAWFLLSQIKISNCEYYIRLSINMNIMNKYECQVYMIVFAIN